MSQCLGRPAPIIEFGLFLARDQQAGIVEPFHFPDEVRPFSRDERHRQSLPERTDAIRSSTPRLFRCRSRKPSRVVAISENNLWHRRVWGTASRAGTVPRPPAGRRDPRRSTRQTRRGRRAIPSAENSILKTMSRTAVAGAIGFAVLMFQNCTWSSLGRVTRISPSGLTRGGASFPLTRGEIAYRFWHGCGCRTFDTPAPIDGETQLALGDETDRRGIPKIRAFGFFSQRPQNRGPEYSPSDHRDPHDKIRDNNDFCSLLTAITACRKSLGLSVAMVILCGPPVVPASSSGFGAGAATAGRSGFFSSSRAKPAG